MFTEECIRKILHHLHVKAEKEIDSKSVFANSILDFFDLESRFAVHAFVYRDMYEDLIRYIKQGDTSQETLR